MQSRKSPSPEPLTAPSRGSAPPAEPALSREEQRRAFIDAEVERAAAPLAGLFPPDVLSAFRERTALFLETNPDMVRLVDAALPPPDTQRSEVVATGAPPPARALSPSGTSRAPVKRHRKPGDAP